MATRSLIGLDLGKLHDPSAVAIIDRTQGDPVHPHEVDRTDKRSLAQIRRRPPATYAVRHLYRFPLGTSYPQLVEEMGVLLEQPELHRPVTFVLDVTGVGRGPYDAFRMRQIYPKPITITGGYTSTRTEHGEFHTTKQDLVYHLQAVTQDRPVRLGLDALTMPLATELRAEMEAFTRRQDPVTGFVTYEALRQRGHDDMVLAISLCVWWGEVYGGRQAYML